MTFESAIEFLDSRIHIGWKLGLDSMNQMLNDLDNPHKKSKFVHIAGTNGKGSVASMLASIFKSAGYTTGLYTSPHLVDVRERIQINNNKIDKNNFVECIDILRPIIEKYNATYFETLTSLAFLYFAKQETEIVVLETGLGGRLDATNVVLPELSIITNIDFDHTDYLGTTLAEIAGEKAGIIKQHRPCLIGELPNEAENAIIQIANDRNSPLHKSQNFYQFNQIEQTVGRTTFSTMNRDNKKDYWTLSMNGTFQVANACIAVSACDILNTIGWAIHRDSVQSGLQHVSWPGRFQVLQHEPTIILDVAHNTASIQQLVQLLQQFYQHKKIIFCIGVLGDKDYREMAKHVASIAHIIQPVEVQSHRALPAWELQSVFQRLNGNVFPPKSLSDALNHVLAIFDTDTVLCITGSHYVVGEALALTKDLTK